MAQSEAFLKREIDSMRVLLDKSVDGIFAFDREMQITHWNLAMERITGVPREVAMGRHVFEPFPFLRSTAEMEEFHQVLTGATMERKSVRVVTHEQEQIRYFDIFCSPFVDQMGRIEGGSVVVHDSTERHQTEAALQEANEQIHNILESITERTSTEEELRTTKEQLESFIHNNADAIWMVDLEERVHRSNASFEKIFGWSEAELYGKKLPIVPDFLAEDMDALHQRVKNGESFMGFETRRLHKNGSLVYVSATLSPIRDVEGQVIGITGICRDISNNKMTEEMLLKSEKLAVAGQLAAGVAHEIRNPLTALKGFVQLMQVGGQANDKYLQVMSSELNRIELIISELLVLAKPQAMVFKQKNVLDILEDVITISETQAILKNVQIVKEYEPGIPLLDCDENQLKQVFINFIKNAIESMQQGGKITVQVRRCEPEHMQIRISDQGCGIPQEILSRLGEPFYTTKEKGTGLGLMVSHKIIENHGGKICVTSEVNVGTTFEVILPLVHQE